MHPEVLGRRPGPKPLHTHVCGRQGHSESSRAQIRLGRAHGVTVRGRVSAWWSRVTSPPISAVAGNRLSLSHTRPKLLGHECRSTRSLPAPKFLGRAPHGVTVQYWSRYPAWQQTENPARCAYLYFVVPIVLPPHSYSPVRPREGSVLAVAHGGAIRPFRTSPSRNRKTYR